MLSLAEGKCVSGGREVLYGTGNGGMYLLSSLGDKNAPTTLIAKSQLKLTTLKVWHRCFGHASIKTI